MKYNSSWIATCLGDSVNSVRDSVVQSCVMRIFIGGCGAPHVKREVGFVDTPLRRVRHSQGGTRDSSGFKLDFPLPGASVSAFHSVIECGNGGSFIFFTVLSFGVVESHRCRRWRRIVGRRANGSARSEA